MEIVAVALISSVVGPTVLWFLQRQTRRDEARERSAVANAVAQVAADTTKANADRTTQLKHISDTGDATHAIVNSDKTRMLRQIAVMARALAADHPNDEVIEKAAQDAEADLATNIALNADPDTKVGAGRVTPSQ